MTIDASRLQIDLVEGERWRRTVNITVPADVVSREREQILSGLSGRVRLPGFRKGKIPANVLKRRYGQAVEQETVDKIIGDAYREAIQREELRPISEGEIGTVQYEPEQDLSFEVSFDVQPEIEVGRLGGFVVERPSMDVSEDDVDRVLQHLREQNGAWRPVEEGRPEPGDVVSVVIQQLNNEDAEPRSYEFVLGKGDALPDVEEAIQSVEVGSEGEFVIAFPADFPDEELKGSEQRLRIAVESRKVLELPDLEDDFAQSLDFESVADLREKLVTDLEKEAAGRAEDVVRSRLLDSLIEANSFEVPGSMVERYLDSVIGDPEGVPPEKIEEAMTSLRPEAEMAVKRLLVMDRVADTQSLHATEGELDERIEDIASRNDATPGDVYAQLQKSGRMESLEREVTERKVFEFLKDQSEITETT